jgi:hypothetical protein
MDLIIDGAVMADILRSPSGMVARHLMERATAVQYRAKELAPRRTGCLESSIVKRVEHFGDEIAVRIVSDTTSCSPSRTSYSYWVHEGTAPHVITARNGGVLAFQVGGETVFARSVNHPGTRANPFLRDALPLAVV